MALINSLLVSLLAYFGVVVGLFIATMTKLEVRQGHKLLEMLKQVLIFIIIGVFLYYSRNDLLFLGLGIILGLLLGYSFKYLYFYLGIAMSLSFLIFQDLLIGIVIFLVGLPSGSLISNLKKKELHKYLIKSLIFFFIPFLILLIPANLSVLIGLMIGGFIYELKWPFS
jgi:hypothetical protein